MEHLLLKNTGDTYFQTEYISLSDQVNSLSKFLSISPKEFMEKITAEFPKSMKFIPGNSYDVFDIEGESRDFDDVKNEFSKRFKELVHENNHRMPLRYKIMDKIIEGYSDRKINDLATLKFWRFGNQRFFTNSYTK